MELRRMIARESRGSSSGISRNQWLIGAAFSLITAVAVLGPMLKWGFPLRYDLVSVPDPQFNPDTWGLGDGLPRAVPLDAVTITLSHVFPDAWLTQAYSLLVLVAAGLGVFRLVPGLLAARLTGAFAAIVNPFVMEQLAIGHVPHLMAYAMLPWIALICYSLNDGSGKLAGLTVAVALGSITPGGGALCLLLVATCVVFLRIRPFAPLAIGVGLQLPWVLTGLVSADQAGPPSDPARSVAAFALRSETGWGTVVDALGLSGMWNQEVLPADRTVALTRLTCVLFIGLSLVGARMLGTVPGPVLAAAGFFVGVTFFIAVLPAVPGARILFVDAIGEIPALGLLRDGHRWLAPLALAEAVLIGMAVSSVRTARQFTAAKAILVVCLIAASLVTMFTGLIRTWDYPADFVQAARLLNAEKDRSPVLILPWSSFRDYTWVDRNTVLDPMPRMLNRKSVVSRVLIVAGRPLQQEGELATAVDGAVADGQLGRQELRSFGWVLTERQTSGRSTAIPEDWPVVFEGPDVVLRRNPQAVADDPPDTGKRLVAYAGFGLYGLLFAAALGVQGAGLLARVRSRRRDSAS